MTMSISEVHAALTAPGQMFEMDEVDIRGVPTRVWKNAPPTLRTVLELSRAHGPKDFLVYAEEQGKVNEVERTTFEDHFRQAATIGHRLVDLGVQPGDRVAIAMRNFPEWAVAFWGAAAAGAVVVPLNAWWTGPELEYGLADSEATVLFADSQRLERLAPHLGNLDLSAVVVARGDAGAEKAVPYKEFLGEVAADVSLPEVELHPEDDATIFYTSGTTGRPKGALGTQRNICTNLLSLIFAANR